MFNLDILKILGRDRELFLEDIQNYKTQIESIIKKSSFLIIGGAGSIGSATIKQIFIREPKLLHVVDINENNLAELVRDLRSSYGYIDGEFKTFVIDVASDIFDCFINDFGKYDYILNFSALKHVRSEKDKYSLMRMIEVNILNSIKLMELAIKNNVKKFFCVSTDKATNPVNMMGASKRIMELFLLDYSNELNISTARFANVAFSDGSLPYSFLQRIQKNQPLVIPNNIKRYFITPNESGILCLLSSLFGQNREIFFPKLNKNYLISFKEFLERFLEHIGYKPYYCDTEEEARTYTKTIKKGYYPCYISSTDTTGEKEFEEFYTLNDNVDLDRFTDIGIIKTEKIENKNLKNFLHKINEFKNNKQWSKNDLVILFNQILPEFLHKELGKSLDDKM